MAAVVGDAPAFTPVVTEEPRRSGSFRTDIQGLRALAVVLVILDHARLGPFHGGYIGVDVFFVISGFLITGLLLAEAGRSGRISLLGFYARRARRIIPAATVVLASTVVAGYYLLPGVDALRLFKDAVWATFFAANLKFASDQTNYWAQDDATSPLQHFWSLAVEEQFYLVWPLVALVLVAVFHKRGRSRRAVVVAIASISVVSFAYAVFLTSSSPQAAYFSTSARAWELGLGAAVAALVHRAARLPQLVLTVLSVAGVLMVVTAAVTFTEGTGVPGPPTLLPVVGTALLLAGGAGRPGGVQALLSIGPARWVGDRSYSLYLWHWPALVLAAATWGRLEVWQSLLVVAGAVVLSDLTYRFVENPFRSGVRWRARWRGLALYPVSVGLMGVVVFAAHTALVHEFNDRSPAVSGANFGGDLHGRSLSKNPDVRLVQQSVLAAENDVAIPNPLKPTALGIADSKAADLGTCEYWQMPQPMPLCPRGDVEGTKTMVLLGDSHMRHWIPAVEPIAKEHGYKAYFLVLQGCPPALVKPWSPYYKAPDPQCDAFQEWSQEQIEALRPDVVVMSMDEERVYLDDQDKRVKDPKAAYSLLEKGMQDRIEQVQPFTKRIVVLADPPRLMFDPAGVFGRDATLADGLSDPLPRSVEMRGAVSDAAKATGADEIETGQWFCAYGKCPLVIGDFITRRDPGHITTQYSRHLSRPLEKELGPLLERTP